MRTKIVFISAILIMAVCAVLVSGCSTTETSATPTPTAAPVSATEIKVFAAGALNDVFTNISNQYEAEHPGVTVMCDFDSSPNLQTQIEQGAEADVFASAAPSFMNNLKSEGYMNNSTIGNFVSNKVALIVPKDNKANITTLKDLARPGVRIAYGASSIPISTYASQVLSKMSNNTTYGADYQKNVMRNVISNETTVNFIVSKVALDEVDAGFVYVSDVPSEYKDKVTVITIPDQFQPTIVWPIGVLKASKSPSVAQDFINYVRSPKGNATMRAYGFVPV